MIPFEQIYKTLEQHQLTSLYLYSITSERKVTESDYKSVTPENLDENSLMFFNIIKKVILRMEQEDQKEWFRWSLNNVDSTKRVVDNTKKVLDEILPKIENYEGSQEELDTLVNSTINEMINYTCKTLSKSFSQLHASVLKKFIVYFLDNGIDFSHFIKPKVVKVSDEELKNLWKKKIEETENPKLKEHLKQLARQLGIDIDY